MKHINNIMKNLKNFLDKNENDIAFYSIKYFDFISNELIIDLTTESKSFYLYFLSSFNDVLSFDSWDFTFKSKVFTLSLFVDVGDDDE